MNKEKKSAILRISPYKDKNVVTYKCVTCGEPFETYQGSRQQNCDECISKKVKQGRPKRAGVAKQANATDLKSVGVKPLQVRDLPPAPKLDKTHGFNMDKSVLSEIAELAKKARG